MQPPLKIEVLSSPSPFWKLVRMFNPPLQKGGGGSHYGYVSTLRKKVFSVAPMKFFFSLGLKLLRFFCFRECWFWKDQRSQFENNRFFTIFLQWTFFVDIQFLWKSIWWRKYPPICYIGCFVEYHEYPEYLFQNIQLKTACLDLCSFGKQIVYILFLFCVFYES